mgnify:CR=1 FL=1
MTYQVLSQQDNNQQQNSNTNIILTGTQLLTANENLVIRINSVTQYKTGSVNQHPIQLNINQDLSISIQYTSI